MWDNNTPLQLLNSMPSVLEDEHLEKLEMLIQADKYKNQLITGSDLCGIYAPFCENCNKEEKYPCAVAYVNYMQSAGMDIKIAEKPVEDVLEDDEQESLVEPTEVNTEDQELLSEEVADAPKAEELQSEEEVPKAEEPQSEEDAPAKEKLRIRIAIARKRVL